MKDNKQELQAGDHSTNYQANRDVVVNGLIYSDVERICMTMFKANFYDLQQEAKDIALSRAEEITSSFLEKLVTDNPLLLKNTNDPDIRYDIYEVQKTYARSGDANIGELLTTLLVERTKKERESLAALVLNEALTVVPKITKRQIDVLTTIFLVRNCKMSNENCLINKLSVIMPHEAIEEGEKSTFYEHLLYAGVITHDLSVMSHQKLEYLLENTYTRNLNEEPFKDLSVTMEERTRVFNNWDKSLMKGYALTSVGKAIALTNYNLLFSISVDLNTWIQD